MPAVVADTHVLLWMLRGSLRERSAKAAEMVESALRARARHVSVGSFLDLRYLVDSGRMEAAVLDQVRSVIDGDAFVLVPLDMPVIAAMENVSRDDVPDPFDRIIAATALHLEMPLVTADESVRKALGERAVW